MTLSLPSAPRYVVPFFLLHLLLVGLYLLESLSIFPTQELFRYESFNQFPDFWRIFTYPWVHESWSHLVSNQLALILAFLLFAEHFSHSRLWLFALLCAPVSAIAIYWWQPETNFNTGFSAIIYGYLVAGGISDALYYRIHCSQRRLFIGAICAIAVFIKATTELFLTPNNVSVSSHYAGVCFGIMWAVVNFLYNDYQTH